MKEYKFPYEWTLKDAVFTKDKGKVFSCFSCGGGSTMGYKLAGFDVIGCNEIDPKMMEAYIANHNPCFPYLESIQTFKDRDDLPPELYDLDILDGSPPCSSFSMAGNREKDWGKEKKFREGQADQVLDTLFFDFIALAKKLQPKVVIAENVKGLLMGDAQKYVSEIYDALQDAGYYVAHKLLDASKMGVPQRRERVFFYAIRKDLYQGDFMDLFQTEPRLDLNFNEAPITFGVATEKYWDKGGKCIEKYAVGKEYGNLREGEQSEKYFQLIRLDRNKVCPTLVGSCDSPSSASLTHPSMCRKLNKEELCNLGSYPQDFNFQENLPGYIIGMSVPPVMTAQVASCVLDQWLTIKTKPKNTKKL